MTDAEQNPPELEIQSDEDWKARVQQEDAQLDAERESTSTATTSAAAQPSVDDDTTGDNASPPDAPPADAPPAMDVSQLLPPEFETLVSMFSTQAMVALGILPSPIDGKANQQLPLAKHFIDLLGVLEEKTRGNLSESEQTLLEQSLHELRMAYVELSRAG